MFGLLHGSITPLISVYIARLVICNFGVSLTQSDCKGLTSPERGPAATIRPTAIRNYCELTLGIVTVSFQSCSA